MPGDTRGYAKPGTDESPATAATLKPPKLPKNIVPLPDDTPEKTWRQWPRYTEVRVFFPHVRERTLTAKVTAGQIPVFYCPDGSARINREHLVAIFGEPADQPPPNPNPLSALGRELRGDDGRRGAAAQRVELELDDPVVGMFRECREMLKASNDFNAQLIKALMDPIGEQMKLLRELSDRFADRVTFLENRQDQVMAEREAMSEFRHERDLEFSRLKAQEDRRAQLMGMLKAEFPKIVAQIGGGESLAEFVADLSPELVQSVIDSGLLPSRRVEQLKKIVQSAAAKPVPHAESNGVSQESEQAS